MYSFHHYSECFVFTKAHSKEVENDAFGVDNNKHSWDYITEMAGSRRGVGLVQETGLLFITSDVI